LLYFHDCLLLYSNFIKQKDKIMTVEAMPKSYNLLTLARVGRWVTGVSAILILGYYAYLIAVPLEAFAVMAKDVPGIQTPPAASLITAATLVASVPVAAFLLALSQIWYFFGEVKNRRPYSLAAQRSLQWLGRAAIACAISGVLARTVIVLILTSANPPGQKMLIIGISSGEVAAMLIAVLVFVFANIVREAAALLQENEMFV
jgi:hypothetical protein